VLVVADTPHLEHRISLVSASSRYNLLSQRSPVRNLRPQARYRHCPANLAKVGLALDREIVSKLLVRHLTPCFGRTRYDCLFRQSRLTRCRGRRPDCRSARFRLNTINLVCIERTELVACVKLLASARLQVPCTQTGCLLEILQ
jgi:hypothetical protein